ncbi:grasp-with-spasm system ATP-grasp peptide maturase [Chryseotalea sanaruensis]|uniref:Grasp-with-spasm system ATP-grasp peptide maturase n=1 Tax=Chryseotalea sanaruensis TaxID=2482724 RepID=A0A401U7N5_9BACT|nr:grasp-with-spasm system ATP-grasp peptide maturase [Chryseotalea sanaruensis]GCC50895.1 grasp-with-spasm system ATP-grasp peptide maturase [Chryseotalea sanaruensis]
MILIFSEEQDFSTCEVIDWLNYYEVSWIRLNDNQIENLIIIQNLNQTKFTIDLTDHKFNYNQIRAYWYRRGNLKYKIKNTKGIDQSVLTYLETEWNSIRTFIYNFIFENLPGIGNPKILDDLNKIIILERAKSVGLFVPSTMITSKKFELINFYNSKGSIITKGVHRTIELNLNEATYSSLAEELLEQDIDNISDTFFPSLFQEKIDKEYEIRSFYLNGSFYSMAMFSQLNKETLTDFRSPSIKPLRSVPYSIPNNIQNRLGKLMKSLKLNSGSIDLVVDKKGDFYFLEINPIGQYDNLSKKCNYHLDRKIAEHLIEISNSRT